MSVRKRTWRNGDGSQREAWVAMGIKTTLAAGGRIARERSIKS